MEDLDVGLDDTTGDDTTGDDTTGDDDTDNGDTSDDDKELDSENWTEDLFLFLGISFNLLFFFFLNKVDGILWAQILEDLPLIERLLRSVAFFIDILNLCRGACAFKILFFAYSYWLNNFGQ